MTSSPNVRRPPLRDSVAAKWGTRPDEPVQMIDVSISDEHPR